jgi:hypothetical protein
MSKRLPSIVLFLIAGALLIYTASQTLDLLKLFLPTEQAPLAYLALVAFDGGLLGWSYFFAKGARGSWQRSIAAIMIAVSIAAVVIGFGGETFFKASEKGLVKVTQDMSTTVVWAVCAVIAANVVAIVVTHLTSPEHRKSMAEEEANDVIEDAVIDAIKKCAPMTARQIAPRKVEEWVTGQIQFYLPGGVTHPALPAPAEREVVSTLAQTGTVADAPDTEPGWIQKLKDWFSPVQQAAPAQEPVPAQGQTLPTGPAKSAAPPRYDAAPRGTNEARRRARVERLRGGASQDPQQAPLNTQANQQSQKPKKHLPPMN